MRRSPTAAVELPSVALDGLIDRLVGSHNNSFRIAMARLVRIYSNDGARSVVAGSWAMKEAVTGNHRTKEAGHQSPLPWAAGWNLGPLDPRSVRRRDAR